MVNSQRLQYASSEDTDTLAAAIARAALGARWQTLVACTILGGLGVMGGRFVTPHRVLLVSAAIAVGAFGSGGWAHRILASEHAGEDPDRLLVAGLTGIRWLSAIIGSAAAITSLTWVFFRLLGTSHMTWH